MSDNLWVFVAVISGFMGFLLGYSTPPMMEIGLKGDHGEIITVDEQETSEEQDLTDYYKQLQDIK